MIYLFRKRNGSIVATTKENASSMYATPDNFITYQPKYLGAVTPAAFKNVGDQAEKDVPIAIELIVKKDGIDTSVTLDLAQINDLIEAGDKKIEARYQGVLQKQQTRYRELLEELAAGADKSKIPVSYEKKIAAIEDAVGDPKKALNGYVHEQS